MSRRFLQLMLSALCVLSPIFSQSFHFFGWSSQGHFAWFEKGQDTGGDYYHFHIMDLISDEVLVQEKVYSQRTSTEAISQEIRRRYPRSLEEYGILSQQLGQPVNGENFRYQSENYRVLMVKDSIPWKLRVINLSDNTYKDVASLSPDGAWDLNGLLISPYEKRAALVLSSAAGYQAFGAHLTIGFQGTQYQAGELIEAVLCGQYYIARLLLDQGVDVNSQDNRGYNALLLAARNDKWDIAELLVLRGADPKVRDALGDSPLHYAVRERQLDTVEALCRAGASPNWDNHQGKSPLDLASGEVLDLLRSYQ